MKREFSNLEEIAECLGECATALFNRGGMLSMDLARDATKLATVARDMARTRSAVGELLCEAMMWLEGNMSDVGSIPPEHLDSLIHALIQQAWQMIDGHEVTPLPIDLAEMRAKAIGEIAIHDAKWVPPDA